MKKKIISMVLSCSMLLNIFTSPLNVKADTKTTGKTYYVSTIDGSDKNDGLSESKAFYSLQKINEIELEPGDKVLLEANSVFTNGFLHIKGSGSEEAPILIDKYGDGNNPRIDTNGQGVWYQDYGKQLDNSKHKYKGYVSSSILLYDVEYINIKNLEITNNSLEIDNKYNSTNTMNRTGVAAVAQNKGTIDHIYLDGLNIHDVMGNVYDKHMNNGGIYFTVFQPKNEAETGISRYNDVKIENCIINNVNRWGIAVGYTAYWDKFLASEIPDDVIAKYGSTGVQIRNNYVKDAGGDAITTMYCDRPLIEYNVSDGVAKQINDTDYSETGFGKVAAGIWPWKCKNATFQYNEVFDTCVNQDGQAWDADSGDGTIYQYNYSHNNGGGAVMICLDQAVNTVFRYNISENDLGGVLNLPGHPKAEIYNNTFYIKEGVPFIRSGMTGGVAVVENNIIYNAGTEKSEEWTKENSNVTYSNNLYYNYSNLPTDDTDAITADPKFVNGGNGPKDYKEITPVAGTNITHDLSAFDGYKLQDDSQAINAGKVIENNGGRDFFGNKIVGTPDIGAYESDGEVPEEVDKTLLGIFVDYAEDAQENGALENVVPAVVNEFETALNDAKNILADKNATEVQVELASKRLINVIHMLDFKKGDKTELKKLIKVLNTLDEVKYTPSTWAILQDKLEKANSVISDANAMEKEINEAYESLINAFTNLEVSSDKSKLEKLVSELEGKDLSKYTQGTVSKFNSELANAKSILDNGDATQEQVNEAYNKLVKAYLDLRLVPDKAKLEELLNKAQAIDTTKYTRASVYRFNAHLANVKAVLNNEEATQKQVDEAEKGLELAMANLEEIAQVGTGNNGNTDKENNNTSNGNNVNNDDTNKEIAKGDTNQNSRNNSNSTSSTGKGNSKLPSTGGTSSVAVGSIALLITGVGAVLRRRK